LSGTVEDPQGAVVPGVAVAVLNLDTALLRQTVTSDSGSYTFPLLSPGRYTVTAEREGFARLQIPGVVLNVGDRVALNIKLTIGSAQATVTVQSEAPLINESPTVATTIDRQFVGNLPLNGRSFQSLILLTPGVVLAPATGGSQAGQFSVNGQRTNSNYFTVDGVSANASMSVSGGTLISQQLAGQLPTLTAFGTTSSLVSIDALEEFKIQTSTYSAEYGRQPGGQVQLITRSGGNQFHGTGFDYVRNDIFDARNAFNTKPSAKPPLRQNQFGGTFSGPVMLPRFGEGGKSFWNGKDSTFFFFSYEGLRLLLPASQNTVVPSLRLRQIAAPAFQPFLNAYPLPTGPENMNAGVPTGSAPYQAVFSNPSGMDATSIRLDHAFSAKLAVFGRYNDTRSNSLGRNLAKLVGGVNTVRSLTVGANLLVGSAISNEFRFNWSQSRGRLNYSLDNFGGAVPVTLSQLAFGYSGPGPIRGTFNLGVPGNPSPVTLGNQYDSYQQLYNLVDNLSWTKGAHQIKAGIDYRRVAPTYGSDFYNASTYTFNEAAVVSGIPNLMFVTSNQGARPRFDNYSVYAQDSWRPSRRLTLDLGLRWELNPAPYDADGKKPVVVALKNIADLPTATLAPPNVPFYKTFYTAFAPRFGGAYLLRQKSGRETVLRAGIGMFYDLNSGSASRAFFTYPFSSFTILTGSAYPFATPPPPPPPRQVTLPIPAGNTVSAINPDLKLPYTLEWNLAVQQSLGQQQTLTISYVGSAGRRLMTTQSVNNVRPSGTRPNPNFQAINYFNNGATSDYNALQVQFQRRLSRGLQALVSYTWSHAIDSSSDEVDPGYFDRSNSSFDIRHNFTTAVRYELPTPRDNSVVRALFGKWAVNATTYVQSGAPFSVAIAGVIQQDGSQVIYFVDRVPGQPFWIDGRLNFDAFAPPPKNAQGQFLRQGTLPRNAITGRALYQINSALERQFGLSERLKLQLKWEVFNLFNHPQYVGYNTCLSCGRSSFGLPQYTLDQLLGGTSPLYQIGGNRSMQFSARLSF
jgi:hypothetical protein